MFFSVLKSKKRRLIAGMTLRFLIDYCQCLEIMFNVLEVTGVKWKSVALIILSRKQREILVSVSLW